MGKELYSTSGEEDGAASATAFLSPRASAATSRSPWQRHTAPRTVDPVAASGAQASNGFEANVDPTKMLTRNLHDYEKLRVEERHHHLLNTTLPPAGHNR